MCTIKPSRRRLRGFLYISTNSSSSSFVLCLVSRLCVCNFALFVEDQVCRSERADSEDLVSW